MNYYNLKLIQILSFFCLFFSLFSCATSSIQSSEFDQNNYLEVIDKNTRLDQKYSGFYQKAQVQATFLNSEVTQQILKKQLNQLQWSDETLQKEREKAVQKNASQTVFFLSFFTPEKELNDLNKGVSIWKLYLDIDGNRYEGKAKKSNDKYVDIKALFPYHNRWSFAYRVYFDIPLSAVENKNFKFVLTSSQGTSELVF